MKAILLALSAVGMLTGACVNVPAKPSTAPSPPVAVKTPAGEVTIEAEIYAAVVRRLVTEDNTFGRGASPFEHIYIVDGAVEEAGDVHKGALRTAPERFSEKLRPRLQQQLADLPPIDFISDPNEVRLGREGMGGVRNDGVIISLGPIEREDDQVHVSNGLWCGGTCGHWLTYVLREDQGDWKITGFTGPRAIS